MSLAKNIGAFLKDRFSLLSVFDGAVLNAYALVLALNLSLGRYKFHLLPRGRKIRF